MTRAVLCLGGPLDGQRFTYEDWQERVESARYMAEKAQERAPALGYRPGAAGDLPDPLPKALREAQPPYTVVPLLWKEPTP